MANGKTQEEYYGYKAPKPFDWVTASQKGLAQVQGAITKREKERADNETTRRETSKTLERLEQGRNRDYNEVVTDGSFVSKDWVYDLTQKLYNNEINSKEYRMAMNNVQDGWDNFSDISKTFNEKLELFAESDGSIVEGAAAKEFGDMGNFHKKKIEIGPDGKVYWAMLDDKGDVIPGKTQSMTSINKTPQQLHERVHLTKEIGEYEKEVGTWKTLGQEPGVYKIEGSIAMEALWETAGPDGKNNWDNWVSSVTAQMLDDPNKAASVLGDNSTYGDDLQTYFAYDEADLVDPNDLSKGFKEGSEYYGKDAESITAIKLIRDGNSQYEAQLTEDQMKQARHVIENEMRTQVGAVKIPDPIFADRKLSDVERRRRESASNIYKNSMNFVSREVDIANFNDPASGITEAAWTTDGHIKFKKDGETVRIELASESLADRLTAAQQLAGYMKASEWDRNRDAFEAGKKRIGTKAYGDPTVDKPEGVTSKVYDLTTPSGKVITIDSNPLQVEIATGGGGSAKKSIYEVTGKTSREQEEFFVKAAEAGKWNKYFYGNNEAVLKGGGHSTETRYSNDLQKLVIAAIRNTADKKVLKDSDVTIKSTPGGKDVKVVVVINGKEEVFQLKDGLLQDIYTSYLMN